MKILLIISLLMFAACVAGDFRFSTDADGNIAGAGFDRADEEDKEAPAEDKKEIAE